VKGSDLIILGALGVGAYFLFSQPAAANPSLSGAGISPLANPNKVSQIININKPTQDVNTVNDAIVNALNTGWSSAKTNPLNNYTSPMDVVVAAGGKSPQIIPTAKSNKITVIAAANQFISKPLTSAQNSLALAINQKFGNFDAKGNRI